MQFLPLVVILMIISVVLGYSMRACSEESGHWKEIGVQRKKRSLVDNSAYADGDLGDYGSYGDDCELGNVAHPGRCDDREVTPSVDEPGTYDDELIGGAGAGSYKYGRSSSTESPGTQTRSYDPVDYDTEDEEEFVRGTDDSSGRADSDVISFDDSLELSPGGSAVQRTAARGAKGVGAAGAAASGGGNKKAKAFAGSKYDLI